MHYWSNVFMCLRGHVNTFNDNYEKSASGSRVSDMGHCWQVMYDATGVRLQAGRQAEVCCLVLLVFFFSTWNTVCLFFTCAHIMPYAILSCQTWGFKCHGSFSVCLWLLCLTALLLCFSWFWGNLSYYGVVCVCLYIYIMSCFNLELCISSPT